MSIDSMTLATRRNRVHRSSLELELRRLGKEQQNEVRMLNNEKQKFKAKYSSKLDLMLDKKSNDSSDVRMYETHNPGFCYKRNGEYRISQTPSVTHSMQFEEIHSLLFTSGQVDIEKILCLHLLAAHKTETLKTPPRIDATTTTAKDQSPVERLLERSKRKHAETMTKMLPTYVLDINVSDVKIPETKKEEPVMKDGRLAARLLINEKIHRLIDTVMVALQKSNPEKIVELIQMAENPETLQTIMNKPHIQTFVRSLKNHMLISSCESFLLTQPFKTKSTPLEIKTLTGGLENLVQQIRKNVLQMPKSTWKEKYMNSFPQDASSNHTAPRQRRNSKKENSSTSQSNSLDDDATKNKFAKKDFIAKNKQALGNVKKFKYNEDDEEEQQGSRRNSYRRRSRSNSMDSEKPLKSTSVNQLDPKPIQKYLENELPETDMQDEDYKVEEAEEEYTVEKASIDLNAGKLAVLLSDKVEHANRKDRREAMQRGSISEEHTPAKEPSLESPKTGNSPQQSRRQSLIKHTTCDACLEKWKEPLPSPKTTRIKKNCLPVLDPETYKEVKTDSTHRISQLINREFDKVKETKSSRRSSVVSNRSMSAAERENFLKKYELDTVELDDLDLAKIRQEIKEKETKKKLENFLTDKKA